MSFLRAEIRALARNWREPLSLAFAAVLGLQLFRYGQHNAAVSVQVLGLLIGIPSALAIIPAVRIVRTRLRGLDPGLVEVTERRITYLGPRFGGSVSIDALTAVEIVVTPSGRADPDIFWTLQHRDGPDLSIPARAAGTNALTDAFAALPGFELQRVVRAMDWRGEARFLIWETQS